MNRKFLLLIPFIIMSSACNLNKDKKIIPEVIISEGFDNENIIFSAPLISDEHVGYKDSNVDNKERLDYALKTLKELYVGNFNAVLACGDQTQDGKANQVADFMSVYKKNFSLDDTPFVFAHGNHDTYWSGCMTTTEFYDAYGDDVYKYDLDKTAAKLGNRHVQINGIDIVAVQVKTFMPNYNDFTDLTEQWFDQTMHAISVQNPDKPVIVLCHSPAHSTIAGSYSYDDSGDWGASKALNVMLKDYPNAILLSGHTHFGITDDLNIMSTSFTSVGLGSICDLDLDANFENLNELSNRRDYSFASIMEIDKNGNTRIVRYDLMKKERIKEPWIIPAPKDDLSHLDKYSLEGRKASNIAPKFPISGSFIVRSTNTGKIRLTFDAFEDDDMIRYYELRFYISNGDEIDDLEDYVMSYKFMDEWWNYPKQRTGKITIETGIKYNSGYKFVLIAYDSFDAYGIAYESK